MGAMTLALTAGGLSALSSIANAGAQNREAKYQAGVAEAQADAARNQAKVTAEQGRIESENLDRERNALTRQYADLQALVYFDRGVGPNDRGVLCGAGQADIHFLAGGTQTNAVVQGLGSTLLSAGLSGLSSGLGAYAMAGGFGGASGGLGGVGSGVKTAQHSFYDRALGRWTSTAVRH